MRFGYITNGFRDHRLVDVLPLLRDLGYEAVGITLDVGHFSHFDLDVAALRDFRASLCGLKPVIETGARYVLDPLRKHRPTLISATRRGAGGGWRTSRRRSTSPPTSARGWSPSGLASASPR